VVKSEFLSGTDYSKAIAGAKVAIVLLNGANNDLHTTRSAEIPAIGTAMCAPRTEHHLTLYKEGEEALFFDGVEECAAQCCRLLADDELRLSIADAGRRRAIENGTFNEPLMQSIVEALVQVRDEQLQGVRG
jgi:spore maturation protein CgeB